MILSPWLAEMSAAPQSRYRLEGHSSQASFSAGSITTTSGCHAESGSCAHDIAAWGDDSHSVGTLVGGGCTGDLIVAADCAENVHAVLPPLVKNWACACDDDGKGGWLALGHIQQDGLCCDLRRRWKIGGHRRIGCEIQAIEESIRLSCHLGDDPHSLQRCTHPRYHFRIQQDTDAAGESTGGMPIAEIKRPLISGCGIAAKL